MVFTPTCIAHHTDGAPLREPHPGGYGYLYTDPSVNSIQKSLVRVIKQLSKTTAWELVIVALEALKRPCQVELLYSDSKYVVDAFNQNGSRWIRKRLENGI